MRQHPRRIGAMRRGRWRNARFILTGGGATGVALLFLGAQASAGGTVATIAPPLGAPSVQWLYTSTSGSGCGAGTIVTTPTFSLTTGAAAETVQATACQTFGTHAAYAWTGFNGSQFTCTTITCPTGTYLLIGNWTVSYTLTDQLYSCTGGNSGQTTVSNDVEGDLFLFQGSRQITSIGVQLAANNHGTSSACTTTTVEGNLYSTATLQLYAGFGPGTYEVGSFIEVQSECETPNSSSADCSATASLTYLSATTTFNWIDVN
jgi:hypothetical protein